MIEMSALYFKHFNKFIILIKKFVYFLSSFKTSIILPWIIGRFVADKGNNLKKLLSIILDQRFWELVNRCCQEISI